MFGIIGLPAEVLYINVFFGLYIRIQFILSPQLLLSQGYSFDTLSNCYFLGLYNSSVSYSAYPVHPPPFIASFFLIGLVLLCFGATEIGRVCVLL